MKPCSSCLRVVSLNPVRWFCSNHAMEVYICQEQLQVWKLHGITNSLPFMVGLELQVLTYCQITGTPPAGVILHGRRRPLASAWPSPCAPPAATPLYLCSSSCRGTCRASSLKRSARFRTPTTGPRASTSRPKPSGDEWLDNVCSVELFQVDLTSNQKCEPISAICGFPRPKPMLFCNEIESHYWPILVL